MESGPKTQNGEDVNTSTEWDSLANSRDKQNWNPGLTSEQREELEAEGITPDTAEYTTALYNYGLKPIADQANQDKRPDWHPGLTSEQREEPLNL